MLTYLLPTHNRPDCLGKTLAALRSLSAEAHEAIGGAEIIIVDNASSPRVEVPRTLRDQMGDRDVIPIRVIRLEENRGTAARNVGVKEAKGEWIVMLDDDSHPLSVSHVRVLLDADDDVAAVGADIFFPDGSREAGGLPEVIIGCGVAIRREAFVQAGGYDPAFDYYAEEYDLCAKLILNGWRIVHDQRFRVRHDKNAMGRDMDRILHRLVRNNGWVMQRYAPITQRENELAEIVSRYAKIAVKENAACGFACGMSELLQTLDEQPLFDLNGMPVDMFDRFTGLSHVRETLNDGDVAIGAKRVAIVDEGKNAWAVRQALEETGVEIINDEAVADLVVIGTLSPGPMLDAFDRRTALGQDVLMPWRPSPAVALAR